MDLDDRSYYRQDGYQYAQTRSSGVRLKVRVIDLEYSDY
jgi:hypothetical protein